jgi:hypothetical protein
MSMRKVLLQVPETCFFNPYVEHQAQALGACGYEVLQPGLCRDEPGAAAPRPSLAGLEAPAGGLGVVHLHWPEKLLKTSSRTEVLALFAGLRERRWKLVRTYHNLTPHDSDLGDFERELVRLVDGHHCFSREQRRRLVSAHGPALEKALVLQHPRFVLPAELQGSPVGRRRAPGRPLTVGCFGRVRRYKRGLEFARAFVARQAVGMRLLLCGLAETAELDVELQALASRSPALEYRSGFLEHAGLISAMREVDLVVLPYASVWSSGILTLAAQLGLPVLAPRPAMLELEEEEARGIGHFLTAWDDQVALDWLERARDMALEAPSQAERVFPDWATAGAALDSYYSTLWEQPPERRSRARA